MAEPLAQKVDDLTIAEPHPEPVDGEKTADTPAASQVRTRAVYTCDANRVIIGRKEEEKEEEEEACSKSRKQRECREQNDRYSEGLVN